MIKIKRKYRFYAAHRNTATEDKCRNLHGHTYLIDVTFAMKEATDNFTVLFSDLDKVANPTIEALDHSTLMWENDKLLKYLTMYKNEHKDNIKIVTFPYETSCENLAKYIFTSINLSLSQNKIKSEVIEVSLQETTSGVVAYGI